MKANPQKIGIVIGAILGGAHLVWSVLVFLGWAQALADFSLWAHMVRIDVVVGPFDLTATTTLVVVAACMGYILGYAAGLVWNKVR